MIGNDYDIVWAIYRNMVSDGEKCQAFFSPIRGVRHPHKGHVVFPIAGSIQGALPIQRTPSPEKLSTSD